MSADAPAAPRSSHALHAFDAAEVAKVQRLLALKVAQMMGRKMEEEDWTSVYCAAKDIPQQGWSNLNVDVMHGALGLEHKMLCYRSKPALRQACGTRLMHPAATRSLRTTDLTGDANDEMRNIFAQYAGVLNGRRQTVADRAGIEADSVDLRTGWLLWQVSLREFMYFEETTIVPDPDRYYAKWIDSADGKRKGSRSLWIYESETGVKRYSLTTSAGVKLQPYFDVPAPNDPNLYHWTVIGEVIDTGDVRLWLTRRTASALEKVVGGLDRNAVSQFILQSTSGLKRAEATEVSPVDVDQVVELVISESAYKALSSVFLGSNDDHLVQLLLDEE